MSRGHQRDLAPSFAKCVLKVIGSESTHSCRDDQLCAVLKVVINEAVHVVQSIWGANSTKEK